MSQEEAVVRTKSRSPPGILRIAPEVADQIRKDIAAGVWQMEIMKKNKVNVQTIKAVREAMLKAASATPTAPTPPVTPSATSAATSATTSTATPTSTPASTSAEPAAPATSSAATPAPTATSAGGLPPVQPPAPATTSPTPTPASAPSRDEEGVQGRAIELFTRGFLPSEVAAGLGLTPEKTLQIARAPF